MSLAIDELTQCAADASQEVLCVYLYGSRARGTAGRASDIDLALLLAASPPATLAGPGRSIETLFERRFHLPTTAIVLNDATPDLIHRVLRDGVILLERDRSRRIRFEVQARNQYFDMAPIRDRYRRMQA